MSKIIDTHTHIYDEQFQEDFDNVMKNIKEQMDLIILMPLFQRNLSLKIHLLLLYIQQIKI